MKKTLFLLLAAITFMACNQKEATIFTLNGSVEGYNTSALYLFEVQNQHYDFIKLVDTIPVTNDKISYSNDSLETQLYFLSTQADLYNPETLEQGAYVFLRKGDNDLKVIKNDQKKMQVEVKNFPLQTQFIEFTKEKESIGNRKVLDSLDQLFYAARDAENKEEMMRIKEESIPYYDEQAKQSNEWLNKKIEENKTSLFGLYLYYTYNFQNSSFSTLEETAKVRERLKGFDEEAKQSVYFKTIEEKLTLMENCAVGSEAPEIVGLDSLDNEVKLSDFRGKYVLVDFWSSSCSWCRKETPNFQKTYNAFKDKNFVILGVSSDFEKGAWLEAIHEDKSYWNHIMMRKNEIRDIMNRYVIVGIPEILLIDPQGVILAKGLRGEAIYNTVAEHVK